MTVFDYLMKGLGHGAYVVGLALMLAAATFILLAIAGVIAWVCEGGEEEEDGEGEAP